MHTAMYLHQFNRNYREKSYREFAQTAKAYGIDQVWFKAFQGGHYATWDPAALALNSLGRVQSCYEECAAEGVEAVFWGVPQANTWQTDATICKSIAAVAGGKIHIDQENFKDFWNAPAYGTAGWVPFYQTLKDAELIVDVSAVARFGEVEITPWEEIIDNIDSVWTQSYAVDFRQPAARVVADDLNAMLRVGVPLEKLGVIQGHTSTRAELDAGWEVARTMGVRRMAIWVWDYASVWPFEFLRDLKAAEPVPVSNDDLYRQIMADAERISEQADIIGYNATPGSDGGPVDVSDAEAVAIILEAVAEIDRARLRIVDLAGQVRI
jgi:hypothetical protein